MKRRTVILLAIVLLLVACGGWIVEGSRRAVGGLLRPAPSAGRG